MNFQASLYRGGRSAIAGAAYSRVWMGVVVGAVVAAATGQDYFPPRGMLIYQPVVTVPEVLPERYNGLTRGRRRRP